MLLASTSARTPPLLIYFGFLFLGTIVSFGARANYDAAVSLYNAKKYASALVPARAAASKGNEDAQFMLGVMYNFAQGVSQDYESAHWWYSLADLQGHAKAQYNLGILYFRGHGVEENRAKAASFIRKASSQGFPEAQYNLALMYAEGWGVEKNIPAANRLYQLAIKQKHIGSMHNFAIHLSNGLGMEIDYPQAINLFERAAKRGYVASQVQLGHLYFNGLGGVPKDPVKGLAWTIIAAKQGHETAISNQSIMEKNMRSRQVTRAVKDAQTCIESSYNKC